MKWLFLFELAVIFALAWLCSVAHAMPIATSYGLARWQFGATAQFYTVYAAPAGTPLAPVTKSTTRFAYVYGLVQGRSYHWAVSATVNGSETPKSLEKSFVVPLKSPKQASLQ